ncbi:hypothetical protein TrLO_g12481 [Triparma laevis f. longispina]|uniref:Uncharacterized protein n=1 Tax=Triparma laevis f. longispina TaxID=1714387 RepID=A0A9W7KZR9_9STRA|nr:hypothetical protein TrLO_g12481 [Triparma laevis f. longispina]
MMKFSFLLAFLLVLQPTASFLTPLSSRINVPASPKISNAKLAKTTNFILNARGAKGGTKREDLSYIESRDMTREEMLEYNKQSEEIMKSELNLMTGASLVISLPILYLCWVAFFSE